MEVTITIKCKVGMQGDEFLKRMQAGDQGVWDDLMPILLRITYGACFSLGVTDSIKDDILQDVAIKVFSHWQTYSGQSALTTWIYQIAKNQCTDVIRKRAVRGEHSYAPDTTDDDDDVSPANEPRHEDKIDLELCVNQLLDELERQVPTRRDSHRMIDVLRFWVENSPTTEELAEFLGTSVQAAKQRKYEIRKHIEALCEKYCGHDDCSP